GPARPPTAIEGRRSWTWNGQRAMNAPPDDLSSTPDAATTSSIRYAARIACTSTRAMTDRLPRQQVDELAERPRPQHSGSLGLIDPQVEVLPRPAGEVDGAHDVFDPAGSGAVDRQDVAGCLVRGH